VANCQLVAEICYSSSDTLRADAPRHVSLATLTRSDSRRQGGWLAPLTSDTSSFAVASPRSRHAWDTSSRQRGGGSTRPRSHHRGPPFHRHLDKNRPCGTPVTPSGAAPSLWPAQLAFAAPPWSGSFRTGLFCRYRGMRYTVSLSHWPQLATLTTCGRPDTEPAIEDRG